MLNKRSKLVSLIARLENIKYKLNIHFSYNHKNENILNFKIEKENYKKKQLNLVKIKK